MSEGSDTFFFNFVECRILHISQNLKYNLQEIAAVGCHFSGPPLVT
jgi:hypothetical protein